MSSMAAATIAPALKRKGKSGKSKNRSSTADEPTATNQQNYTNSTKRSSQNAAKSAESSPSETALVSAAQALSAAGSPSRAQDLQLPAFRNNARIAGTNLRQIAAADAPSLSGAGDAAKAAEEALALLRLALAKANVALDVVREVGGSAGEFRTVGGVDDAINRDGDRHSVNVSADGLGRERERAGSVPKSSAAVGTHSSFGQAYPSVQQSSVKVALRDMPLADTWHGDDPALAAILRLPDELHVAVALRQFGRAVTIIEAAGLQLQRAGAGDLRAVDLGGRTVVAGHSRRSSAVRADSFHRDSEGATMAQTASGKGVAFPGHYHGHALRVRAALEPLMSDLIRLLLAELEDTTAAGTSVHTRHVIAWLSRLGCGDTARQVYLDATTRRIAHDVRQVRLQGDIGAYISELSTLVFSSINRTSDNFRAAFVAPSASKHEAQNAVDRVCSAADTEPRAGSTQVDGGKISPAGHEDGAMLSGLVVWAIDELERFGAIFRSQVFSHNTDDFRTMGLCLDRASVHCKLLDEKGLALSFVLNQMFHPNLLAAVTAFGDRVADSLTQPLAEDDWRASRQWILRAQDPALDKKAGAQGTRKHRRADRRERRSKVLTQTSNQFQVKLTESARVLYAEAQLMSSNFQRIVTVELVPAIAQAFSSVFDRAQAYYLAVVRDAMISDAQMLSIIANSSHISEDLVPSTLRQLEQRLGRTMRDFDKIRKAAAFQHEHLCDMWCSGKAAHLMQTILPWDRLLYTEAVSDDHSSTEDPSEVSVEFVTFFAELSKLRSAISSAVGKHGLVPLMRGLVEEVALRFPEVDHIGPNAVIEGRTRRLVRQLLLDIRFFQAAAAATSCSTASVVEAVEFTAKAATSEFARRNAVPDSEIEPDDAWFTSRISTAFEKHSTALGLQRNQV